MPLTVVSHTWLIWEGWEGLRPHADTKLPQLHRPIHTRFEPQSSTIGELVQRLPFRRYTSIRGLGCPLIKLEEIRTTTTEMSGYFYGPSDYH